jgi:hypothetical protein
MSDDCMKRDMLHQPPAKQDPLRLFWVGIGDRVYLVCVAVSDHHGVPEHDAEYAALYIAQRRHLRATGTLPPREYTVVYMFPPGCVLGQRPGEIDCPASAEPQVVMAGARTISRRGDRIVVSIAQPGDADVDGGDYLPQD